MKNKANIAVGVAVIVVLLAAVGAFAYMQLGAGGGSMRALVHDGDGAVREIPLDRDSETVVTTGLGTNTVVVENGAVFVREADCDNQDCVHQGRLNAPGRQIICLPHKLWIEVVADGQSSGSMDTSAVAGEGSPSSAGDLDAVAR